MPHRAILGKTLSGSAYRQKTAGDDIKEDADETQEQAPYGELDENIMMKRSQNLCTERCTRHTN